MRYISCILAANQKGTRTLLQVASQTDNVLPVTEVTGFF